ncbi:MAG: class I SAM-dependent methyltransferase [Candidatus Omnitrophica bacterium]|nr:class I SAM-dependent methyltransferase [Candidatus Omnitrophota bacterium]
MLLQSMPCALCGTTVSGRVKYKENFRMDDLNEKTFSARRLPDRIHYRILRCPQDGMVWSSPVLSAGDAAKLYKHSSFSYTDEIQNLTVTYIEALKQVLDNIKFDASILEIGCGNGFMLDALYKKGFHRLYGIEPSQDAVQKTPAHIRERIVVNSFDEGTFSEGTFDLIYFFQTLDHIYDPNVFIAQCFKWLKPGGFIVAFQHNVESISARALGRLSPIIDVEHIYLFSPETIKVIFKKHGFSVLRVYSPINQISLRHLLWLMPISKGIKTKILKSQGKWLSWSIRVKLGNLCLVAQKG